MELTQISSNQHFLNLSGILFGVLSFKTQSFKVYSLFCNQQLTKQFIKKWNNATDDRVIWYSECSSFLHIHTLLLLRYLSVFLLGAFMRKPVMFNLNFSEQPGLEFSCCSNLVHKLHFFSVSHSLTQISLNESYPSHLCVIVLLVDNSRHCGWNRAFRVTASIHNSGELRKSCGWGVNLFFWYVCVPVCFCACVFVCGINIDILQAHTLSHRLKLIRCTKTLESVVPALSSGLHPSLSPTQRHVLHCLVCFLLPLLLLYHMTHPSTFFFGSPLLHMSITSGFDVDPTVACVSIFRTLPRAR